MKVSEFFLSETFHFLLVKISVYLNRHVFVMIWGVSIASSFGAGAVKCFHCFSFEAGGVGYVHCFDFTSERCEKFPLIHLLERGVWDSHCFALWRRSYGTFPLLQLNERVMRKISIATPFGAGGVGNSHCFDFWSGR